MELNTSHYFPLNIENVLAIVKLIDIEHYDIRAGIVLQVTIKQ